MSDGVWVKVHPDDAPSGVPGAAVINGHNGATVQNNVSIDGKTYDIYTFTDDTRDDLSLTVSEPGFIDALIVAGGGGGGNNSGGGGGGGGVINTESVYLSAKTHEVFVGSGGVKGHYAHERMQGGNGDSSQLGVYVAVGGGAGSSYNGGGAGTGGGSGGSAGGECGAVTTGQSFVKGQGNAAGTGAGRGAGGGGAGTAGNVATGGTGITSTITGNPVVYSAGGNADSETADGADNTGNGGSGIYAPMGISGAGGSGIVIVRVEI